MSESTRRPPTTESLGPSSPDSLGETNESEFDDLVRARYRTLPRTGARSGTGPRDAAGSMVGSVRLEQELGTGGMGRVFRGYDERLGRRVAVKTVLHSKRHRRGARARLRREARLLSKINHPRICQLYDLVETDQADYLILELVEGENLGLLIERGSMSPGEGLAHAEGIAEALVAAHRRGIVHRDLKPDNVMITPRQGVKVLDFGIARSPESEAILEDEEGIGPSSLGRDRFRTVRGAVIGTAAYMSPEQARGEAVTPASDIYSFGVLLEELLSGQAPTPEGTESEAIIRVVGEGKRPKPPEPLPRRFAELVASLQAADPSDRPAAAEALAAIRRLRTRRSRILRRVAALAGLLVVVAGVTKYTVDLRQEKRHAQQARGQAEALVSFLLEDLHDGLEPLGRLDLLDRVARRSLDYFESTTEGARPAAEAEALRQVGRVLMDRGDLEAALAAFDRARQIDAALFLKTPDDGVRRRALARDERDMATLLAAKGEPSKALAMATSAAELLRAAPLDDPESRRELAALLSFEMADYQRESGNLEAAQGNLNEAYEILLELVASTPDDPRVLVALGRYHYAHGLFSFFELGETEESLGHYREAIDVYGRLEKLDPLHADYRYRLAVLHGQGLCSVLDALGRREEALAACDEALERQLSLRQEDPSNGRWAHALGWEYIRRVELMAALGDSEAALEAARMAVAIHRETARRAPDDSDWQGGLAIACQVEAELRAERGEWAQAIELLAEARGIQSRFVLRDPGGGWLSELAATDLQLGRLRLLLGDRDLARRDLERALEASEKLFELGSDRAALQIELASTLTSVGQAFLELEDIDLANANLERALLLLEGFDALDGRVLETRALAFLLLEKTGEARAMIEIMLSQGYTPGSIYPELLALCSERGIELP